LGATPPFIRLTGGRRPGTRHGGPARPACVTFKTGPSRSMDLGYVSCVGVHGPGDVTVWVIADE
jgi:L-lactate utilization protein LutC